MNNKPVAWKGLTAQEIATIPNDEFRLQTVERILKERNSHPVKELTGGYEVLDMNEYDVTVRMTVSDWETILRKAQEK